MKRMVMAGAMLLALGTGTAEAGLLSVGPAGAGGVQAFKTPPNSQAGAAPNDVIPSLWGYLNTYLYFKGDLGVQYEVKFTLVGSESSWTNQLRETQGNKTLLETTDFGKTISYLATGTGADQLLKFQFETVAGDTSQPILVNGPAGGPGTIANGGLGAPRTFFVSFCADKSVAPGLQKNLGCNTSGSPTTGNLAWLALDDSGAGPNDNHDDWVGLVEVKAVPDGGATLSLLGAALVGVGAIRRRFGA